MVCPTGNNFTNDEMTVTSFMYIELFNKLGRRVKAFMDNFYLNLGLITSGRSSFERIRKKPQRSNAIDCGVFALTFAVYRYNDWEIYFSLDHITAIRNLFAHIAMEGLVTTDHACAIDS